ncbi:MAG TPA: hypothetical protein VN457_03630, partial [Chlamydiales bacterium]|nr:hypothetical protein [Chlamydiales bacterium]
GTTAVMFGLNPAASYTVVNDGKITAQAPSAAAGTIYIRITAGAQPSLVTPPCEFTYQAP